MTRNKALTVSSIVVLLVLLGMVIIRSHKGTNGQANEDETREIQLFELEGVSSLTLGKQNMTYRVNGPGILLEKENVALFDVTILSSKVDEKEVLFVGDGERFESFVAEIDFINEYKGDYRLSATSNGAVEAVDAITESIWQAVRHPIDTSKDLAGATVAAAKYAVSSVKGENSIPDDIKELAQAAYENTVSEVAAKARFSYEEAFLEESRNIAEAMAKWKLGGRTVAEIGLLLAPLAQAKLISVGSKTAEVARTTSIAPTIARSEGAVTARRAIVKNAQLFSQSGRIASSITRLNRFAAADRALFNHALRHLCNPQKTLTLGEYGANARLHKVLYYMHKAEKEGFDVAKVLEKQLPKSGPREAFFSKQLTKDGLVKAYKEAEGYGIFKSEANVEGMAHGRAPLVMEGEYQGQAIHVDHIIPRRVAPELENNLANLRYLPARLNQSRGAIVDADARALMAKMKTQTGWTETLTFP